MPGQAPLVDLGEEGPRAELRAGVHAHVEGGVVGVGEASLAGVELHRGGAEIEQHGVCVEALAGELLERLGVARADEPHRAAELPVELVEALLGERVAVDRDQRPVLPETLGEQAGVTAPAEGAVHHALAGLRVEQLDGLLRQHGRVRGLRHERRGRPPRPPLPPRAGGLPPLGTLGTSVAPSWLAHLKNRHRHAR